MKAKEQGYPGASLQTPRASLMAQVIKNLHARWETWVRSLGPEDHLEEGMTTHSSILAREMPWTGEPGGLQSAGLQSLT